MFALTATELKMSSGHMASMDRCGSGASGRHVDAATENHLSDNKKKQ